MIRLRRNRKASWIRDLVAETTITSANLILPIFIVEGSNIKEEIKNMPGIFRHSIDQLVHIAKQAQDSGINAIALFPAIDDSLKNADATEAYNLDSLICRAIRALRNVDIKIGIICDVALDPYTTHGHDGIVENDEVDNDKTVEALCNQALVLAKAGSDMVAPSDMMDGRIIEIRKTLDKYHFHNVSILAYAAKYDSIFYSPFRDAIGNKKPIYLNKATYQMDIRNVNEALREIKHDVEEGADVIMIKPGMVCLDIIRAARDNTNVSIFAYQVSGEYAMLKLASEKGILNWERSIIESLIAIKRAGACAIFTYAALEVANILNENNASKIKGKSL